MATSSDLKRWVLDALAGLGGSARVPDIAKHIWDRHEAELRASGDLFYTWQYGMRWAGQVLQKDGKILKNGEKRCWSLAS